MRRSLLSVGLSLLLVSFLWGVAIQPNLVTASSKIPTTTKTPSQNVYWLKTYGGKGNESINAIKLLPNKDMIAVGYINSSGAGGCDALVMKLAPNGSVLWRKTYGGSKDDGANAVALTKNGDIVVVGWTSSLGAGGKDAWVFELSQNGSMIWQKAYGGSKDDVAKGVAVTSNGSILVAGWTESFGAGGKDAWIFKLNPNGSVIWAKTYGGPKNDEANAVVLTRKGNIVVVGWTDNFGAGKSDAWVLKLSPNGNTIWQKTYGGKENDEASAITLLPNGKIIVAGWTSSFGAGGKDAWVFELSQNGSMIWQKAYGGSKDDVANAVAIAPNWDIVVTGWTSSFGAGGKDAWVLLLNTDNGNVIWQKAYGGSKDDEANSVAVTPNWNIIVGGYTESFGTGPTKAWIISLPSNGNAGERYSRVTNAKQVESNCSVEEVHMLRTTGKVTVTNSNAVVSRWSPKVITQFFLSQGKYWAKAYGRSNGDGAHAIALTPNGNMIVVGQAMDPGSGYDAFVMKLAPNGNIIWARTYGGPSEDFATGVAVTPNGDIVVVGVTKSFGAGGKDVWVLKLDPNGDVIWQKAYGGKSDDGAGAVAVTSKGDIIVVGYTKSFGAGGKDVWVLKLDPNGDVIWQKAYGGPNDDEANAVALTKNGDMIVVGYTLSFEPRSTDVWVLKLDPNGDVIWQKAYGGRIHIASANSVTLTSSGDIIIAGTIWTINDQDVWVLKLDPNGDVIWQKAYGGNYNDWADGVALTPNGDLIVVGYTRSFGIRYSDAWVLKLDPNGNIVWQKAYGGKGYDGVDSVVLTSTGCIITAGWTSSFGAGFGDVWILKLPSSNNLEVGYSKVTNAKVITPECFIRTKIREIYVSVITHNITVTNGNTVTHRPSNSATGSASASTSTTVHSSTMSISHTTRTSTSPTSSTSTSSLITSSSSSSASSPTRTTSSKKKGICGPAAIVALALIPLLLKKRK